MHNDCKLPIKFTEEEEEEEEAAFLKGSFLFCFHRVSVVCASVLASAG